MHHQDTTEPHASVVRFWDTEGLKLLVGGVPTEYHGDGSYLVFTLTEPTAVVTLVWTPAQLQWYHYAIPAAAGLLLVAVVTALICGKRKKKA